MLLYVVIVAVRQSRGRDACWCLAAFTAVSLAWFVPLLVATGEIHGFVDYEMKQASYVAGHDAFLARSGKNFELS